MSGFLLAFEPVDRVFGLRDEDKDTLNDLLQVWHSKSAKNAVREMYADGRNQLKDLGIAIPPQLKDVETVVGWPGMAVEKLSEICVFDKVTSRTGADPFGIGELLEANRFDIEVQQGIASSLIHSLSFISTTPGRADLGEPEVMMLFHSAAWSAGIWDRRTRSLRSFLMVNETDAVGRPVQVTLFTRLETTVIRKGSAWYVESVVPNLLAGRIGVEPFPYRPTLGRPLGRSKINRAVRSITDSGVRTVLRSEVAAEFFSAPQRYVLGADEDAFVDKNGAPIPAWKALIGHILALSKDEDGDTPTVGQFTQQSQSPHTEQLRETASRFAAVANLDLSSMGIVQDNPSSAEAIEKGARNLKKDADESIRVYKAYLKRSFQNAVMIRDKMPELTPELQQIEPSFLPTSVLTGDEVVKVTSAMPWLGESTVLLEDMGWDEAKIERALSDKRRAQGGSVLSQILAGRTPDIDAEPASQPASQ